ncbi:MAG: WG repeat-containing protein [Lachnospiraceae bacterium]|nr:WG repeat-containing protein [Lachnospiraceae bacterium]
MKKKTVALSIFAILFFLGFIWLHGFIFMNSFGRGGSAAGVIWWSGLTVAGTIFWFWMIFCIIDILTDSLFETDSTKCMIIAGVFVLILLLGLGLEYGISDFSLYGEEQIILWGIKITKKYIYYIWTVIVFPFFLELAGKCLNRESFSGKSILAGCILTFVMSAAGYLFFGAMSGVYFGNLALLNLASLCAALHKYVWKRNPAGKRKIAAWFLLMFILACVIGIAGAVHGSGSIAAHIYEGNWSGYTEHVKILMDHAAFFGKSEQLAAMEPVYEWLHGRSNFIHQLLFYGGWSAVIGWFVCIAGFLTVAYQMLGRRSGQLFGHHIIFITAFWMFLVRTVLGIFYSFAILPYPVSLPFAGQAGIYTDSMALALLFVCAWENYTIAKKQNCRLVDVTEFLEESPEYTVTGEQAPDGRYDGVMYQNPVGVRGNDSEMICFATGMDFSEEYVVFWPQEGNGNRVFILQRGQNDTWECVKDEKILWDVFSEYKNNWRMDSFTIAYETLEDFGIYFEKYKWRMIAAAILIVPVTGKAWLWSLESLYGSSTSVNRLVEEAEQKKQDSIREQIEAVINGSADTDQIKPEIRYTKEGLYLAWQNGETFCGPYKYIEEEDLKSELCRFVGDNGLFGYLSTADGHAVIEPKYTKASRMSNGSACVSEGDGVYYISEAGDRITDGYYLDGYPFAESYGEYARVQTEDGNWAIITKKEEIILGGLDAVNRLPSATALGSAVRNGHALLFAFSGVDGREFHIVKEWEEFCEISEVYWGECAIVKNHEGLCGVVARNGDIVLPAQYLSIEWSRVFLDGSNDRMMFQMQKQDGTWDMMIW